MTCAWCQQHPGETHFDAQGYPLFDVQHHAGHYIDAETAERIASDGP